MYDHLIETQVKAAELAYELTVTAGRTASQIVINSRRRLLDHLRTGTRRDQGPASRNRVLSQSRTN